MQARHVIYAGTRTQITPDALTTKRPSNFRDFIPLQHQGNRNIADRSDMPSSTDLLLREVQDPIVIGSYRLSFQDSVRRLLLDDRSYPTIYEGVVDPVNGYGSMGRLHDATLDPSNPLSYLQIKKGLIWRVATHKGSLRSYFIYSACSFMCGWRRVSTAVEHS